MLFLHPHTLACLEKIIYWLFCLLIIKREERGAIIKGFHGLVPTKICSNPPVSFAMCLPVFQNCWTDFNGI
jgi:hypothetical protein